MSPVKFFLKYEEKKQNSFYTCKIKGNLFSINCLAEKVLKSFIVQKKILVIDLALNNK